MKSAITTKDNAEFLLEAESEPTHASRASEARPATRAILLASLLADARLGSAQYVEGYTAGRGAE